LHLLAPESEFAERELTLRHVKVESLLNLLRLALKKRFEVLFESGHRFFRLAQLLYPMRLIIVEQAVKLVLLQIQTV